MRFIITVLIIALSVGGIVILLGFLTNQNYVEVSEISNQYKKLENYKNELEKINEYNQRVLKDLENQINNSDNVHLDQINEEIKIIKQVISENKAELEQVIQKLSEIESSP